MIAILLGCILLLVTTGVYFLGRDRMRMAAEGFSSAPGRG
jgi:Tfp pilus assembly protein PilW